MYPPSELASLQTYTSSPTPSASTYRFFSACPTEAYLALNKKGTSCAILTALISDLGVYTPSVFGSVKLMLEDEHAIDAIVVSIKGQIVTSINTTKHFTFLDIAKTIWSKSNDIKRPSGVSADHSKAGQKKLSGDHFWPFSISLPKELILRTRSKHISQAEAYRLPESFHERHVRARVQYSLHLRLVRGKFRADNRTQVVLNYPPGACSELIPFPGESFRDTPSLVSWPNDDPEAWYTHRGVVMSGRLNNQHIIDVKYTLSLQKPLWYARGSVIPFSLAIETSNQLALDILSSPTSPVVRLRRCVKCRDGTLARFQFPAKGDAIDHSHSATWWPSHLETQVPNIRRLSGELRLPHNMNPTTEIAHFSIEYSVVLFPSDTATFAFASEDPIAIVDVEVA